MYSPSSVFNVLWDGRLRVSGAVCRPATRRSRVYVFASSCTCAKLSQTKTTEMKQQCSPKARYQGCFRVHGWCHVHCNMPILMLMHAPFQDGE